MKKRVSDQPDSGRYLAPLACSLAALLTATACGGAAGTSGPPIALVTPVPTATPKLAPTITPTAAPTPTPTVAPTPAERLYVAGYGTVNNTISYFTAPFSATSTPSATFSAPPGEAISGLAIDPSNNVIVLSAGSSTITAFARPNPTTSALYTITSIGTPYDAAFNSGTFYVSNANYVESAPAPLSAASAFTPLITTGLSGPWGIAFDSGSNMYVMEYGTGQIAAYAPPYNAAPFAVVTMGGTDDESIAYDAATDQVIGIQSSGAAVYNLPLTNASTPSATIAATTNYFSVGTTDSSGELFVGTSGPIQVFAPPFSNASTLRFSIPGTQPAALVIGH